MTPLRVTIAPKFSGDRSYRLAQRQGISQYWAVDLVNGHQSGREPSQRETLSGGSSIAASQSEAMSLRALRDAVLNSSVDAYWELDATGHILEWNNAAVKIFGWTRAEALGQLLTELLINPDQREPISQEIQEYVDLGRSDNVGAVSSWTLLHKNGTPVPVETLVTAAGCGPQVTFHVFARDMTELSEARAALYGSEASFEAVFDNAPIGIAVVGLDGSFQRVNQAFCDITGYGEQELIERTFQDITHPDDLDADVGEATRLLHGELKMYQMDKRYYAKDGHIIWVRLSGSIVRDAAGQPLHFIAQIEDVSARKRDEELLMRKATRDSLTGVYNRARFDEELARHMALVRHHKDHDEAALLMIDLDGLKRINDQNGHAAGDEYLKTVTGAINRRLRLSDFFARVGGDEFAVLLPRTSASQAQHVAKAMTEMVKSSSPGSVSIGIAMVGPDQLDDPLGRADQAMYEAKKRGGGCVAGPL